MSNEKLGFKEAFDHIFQTIREEAKKNLAAAEAGTIAIADDAPALKISGDIDVYEGLDGEGKLHKEFSQYAPGVSVDITVVIFSPNDTYSATLWSSGGGGGRWENVHINQPYSTKISTKFWSSTNIKIDVQASSARNVELQARVHYSI